MIWPRSAGGWELKTEMIRKELARVRNHPSYPRVTRTLPEAQEMTLRDPEETALIDEAVRRADGAGSEELELRRQWWGWAVAAYRDDDLVETAWSHMTAIRVQLTEAGYEF